METSELITVLRNDYLDDTVEEYLWSDEFLTRSLSESQRQACNRTDFLFDDSTASVTQITLVDGQASYTLNKKITAIEYVSFDGSELTHKSRHELNRDIPTWRTDTGMTNQTVYFTQRGHTIRFSRVPDATDAGKIVYLEVYRMPIDSLCQDYDEPEIPEEYHRDLIYWTLHEAFGKPDADGYDPDRSALYLQKFNDIFGGYVSSEVRLNQFNHDKTLRVRGIDYGANLATSDGEDW